MHFSDPILPRPTSQDYKRIRLALLDDLRRIPLLREYVEAINSTEAVHGAMTFHNTEAWHAIGEQLLAAVHLFSKGNSTWHSWVADMTTLDGDDEAAVIAAWMCLRATPCLWSTAIEQIAVEQPMPPCTVTKDTCPWPEGLFISRETCRGTILEGRQLETNWILVKPLDAELVVLYDVVDTTSQLTEVVHLKVPYGDTVEDDSLHLFRMLAFMQSSYVGQQRRYASRPVLRRSNNHELVAKATIKVELLRRVRPSNTYTEGEHRDVAHDYQWWVRGHYRNQACGPNYSERRLMYIHPHLAGPDDKPILQKVYKVVR